MSRVFDPSAAARQAQQAQQAEQHQHRATAAQIEQLADYTAQRALQKISSAQKAQQVQLQKRSNVEKAVLDRLHKYSAARTFLFLIEKGLASPEVVKEAARLKKISEDLEGEMVDDAFNGASAEEVLLETLIDDAAVSPEKAADLIQELTGSPIPPEVIDAASSSVAEGMLEEETAGGPTKTSAARNAKLEKLHPVTREIIHRQAFLKASVVLRQEQGR